MVEPLQLDWQSTVSRHFPVELGRIASVLGLHGRTARTAAVARLLARI